MRTIQGKVWVDRQGRIQLPKIVRTVVDIPLKAYISYETSDDSVILKVKRG